VCGGRAEADVSVWGWTWVDGGVLWLGCDNDDESKNENEWGINRAEEACFAFFLLFVASLFLHLLWLVAWL